MIKDDKDIESGKTKLHQVKTGEEPYKKRKYYQTNPKRLTLSALDIKDLNIKEILVLNYLKFNYQSYVEIMRFNRQEKLEYRDDKGRLFIKMNLSQLYEDLKDKLYKHRNNTSIIIRKLIKKGYIARHQQSKRNRKTGKVRTDCFFVFKDKTLELFYGHIEKEGGGRKEFILRGFVDEKGNIKI